MHTCFGGRHGAGDGVDGRVARTAGVVSLAVLVVGLGGLALGVEWAWVAFPVGYGGVLPLVVGRAKARGRQQDRADEREAATDRLRERYVDGEIDETEFERRLETLLATEDEV